MRHLPGSRRASGPANVLRQILGTALGLACTLPAAASLQLTDDTGRTITLARPAQRIVSLAPHVTELLFAAGAGSRVVGVVAYSDFPAAAQALPQVGGYTNVDMEAVAALKPDLVIGWKSGNRAAHLDKLAALGIPLFLNEPRTLEHVARSLETFGRLAGTEATANPAAGAFRDRLRMLSGRYARQATVRVFYQMWDQPLMTVNDEHLISDVIRLCGGTNVFGSQSQLAPSVGEEAVLAANPEAIVASGMGEARPEWLDRWKRWPALSAAARGNLYFVPPELIQRHTPRILDGATMLCDQLEAVRRKRPAAR